MNRLLQVFASGRMLVVLLTGFASGLPLALTGDTLQAWMKSRQIDLGTIGVMGLVGLPYTLKFLWSPLIDWLVPPFLGRRRGWLIICQAALVACIVAMAYAGAASLGLLAVLALLVAFCSASQDIVIDAYRTEILRPHELGAGASLYIMGYRIGMIFSGAVGLVLADCLPGGFRSVYLLLAGTMALAMLVTLLAPEPQTPGAPRTIYQAVVEPLREFLTRRGAAEMLLFILIYKLDWAMVNAMATPFMMDVGFSKADIGWVGKFLGIGATVLGAVIGGSVIAVGGVRRSLWIFGLVQALAGLSFTLLSVVGKSYAMLATAVIVENICSGMATSAFVAFIMSLCNKRFTATQFALLSSLMAQCRVLAGWPSGYLAQSVGWEAFFIIATLAAVPGLVLLTRYNRWQHQPTELGKPPALPGDVVPAERAGVLADEQVR